MKNVIILINYFNAILITNNLFKGAKHTSDILKFKKYTFLNIN